jgi:hypothetical protein
MKASILLLGFALVSTGLFGQGKDNSLEGVPVKERIVTGGGFGFGFDRNLDFLSLSPTIGYSVTKKFVVGVGGSYQYVKYKEVSPGTDFKTNNYGANTFARLTVYEGVFLQTEFEYLSFEGIRYPPLEKARRVFNSFLAGVGYLQPIGDKASFFVMALYNFSYQTPVRGEFVPYNSPIVIRAGINFGGFLF